MSFRDDSLTLPLVPHPGSCLLERLQRGLIAVNASQEDAALAPDDRQEWLLEHERVSWSNCPRLSVQHAQQAIHWTPRMQNSWPICSRKDGVQRVRVVARGVSPRAGNAGVEALCAPLSFVEAMPSTLLKLRSDWKEASYTTAEWTV